MDRDADWKRGFRVAASFASEYDGSSIHEYRLERHGRT